MLRRPPRSTLFPSATLVRSRPRAAGPVSSPPRPPRGRVRREGAPEGTVAATGTSARALASVSPSTRGRRPPRSEEHTSELQSRQYLACRLLLETKSVPSNLFSAFL